MGVGTAVGVCVGVAVGAIVGVVTRSLMHMPTDATPRAADLLGAKATVVTRIPERGFGEVTLVQGGHFMKLAARADGSVREGTAVIFMSADLDELLDRSDRIAVFSGGRMSRVLNTAETSVDELGHLIGGQEV